MVKSKHKIKSIDIHTETLNTNRRRNNKSGDDGESPELIIKISCLLQNNQIEVYALKLGKQINNVDAPELVYTLDTPGHRTDVRTVCFSSDSSAFVSARGDSMKVWNRMGLTCIRTFACDYALSSLFMSDDNHVIISTNVKIPL